MLAERGRDAFSAPGWLFELKYDGFRLLAARRRRPGCASSTAAAPTSPACSPRSPARWRALPYRVLLDGEVVVLDDGGGRASSASSSARSCAPRDIERAAVEHPATFFAFDLLAFEDFDLRALPLSSARSCSPRSAAGGAVRYADHVEERGDELLRAGRGVGLEGIVAKRADSAYRAGRSPTGSRSGPTARDDFVSSASRRRRERASASARCTSAPIAGRASALVYAGRAGTGFATAARGAAPATAREPTRGPAGRGPIAPAGLAGRAAGPTHVWVEPSWCARCATRSGPSDGLLRHPVFVRCGRTRGPRSACAERARGCARAREAAKPAAGEERPPTTRATGANPTPDGAPAPPPSRSAPRQLKLTNLDKVFWPEEGYTKGDLIDYYRAIAPWLLPYLRDRPLVLTRYPDGIDGKILPEGRAEPSRPTGSAPSDLERVAEREIDYFICDEPRRAALHRQPRPILAPHLGEPPGHARAPRLVHPRPRSQGRAVRATWSASRSRCARCARRSGCRLRQDQRHDRPARAGPARPPVHLRAVAAARRALLARDRRASCPRSRPSTRVDQEARRARSISTTSRTATASSWSRPSACARCPARRSRCRSSGAR